MVLLKVCAGMVGQLNVVEQDAALHEALRHALTKPGSPPDRSGWERFYALAAERKASESALVGLMLSIVGAQAG